jgi:DNA repair photolyase
MEVIYAKQKGAGFTKTNLPGCDFVINQYVGCQHACSYCYAKNYAFFKGNRAEDLFGKWGNWVIVKENSPDLVKGKYVEGSVWMSSVSDPYQPIEKKLKLTRKILENLDKKAKLSIQTKSDLVLRDIDLFKQFKNIEIGLTINGFTGKVKKLLEPNSPTHKQRLNTLEALKENGIKTYGFVSPIIPELVDVKKVIEESRTFIDHYWFEVLNLRASGEDFIETLKRKSLKSYKIMVNREKFWEFVKNLKEIIKEEKVKTIWIIVHYPRFEIIKI